MPFPTVKTDPWKKRRRRVRRSPLWPAEWWVELCKQATRDALEYGQAISPACLLLIADFNRRCEADD
jgi:hypothetical protein